MLKKELVPFLIKTLRTKFLLLGEDAGNGRFSEIIHQVFYRMYKMIDKEFFDRSKDAAKQCGAVVNSCLLIGNMLYCINLGDCRAVICRNGKAINMSVDQKATLESEVTRILNLGGTVCDERVFGRLMITRAFGDFELKLRQDMEMNFHVVNFVSNEPDIRYLKINFETDRFLVIASDGVFEQYSSQEVCNFVNNELARMPVEAQDARLIAKRLCNHAIRVRQIKDNVTCIVVIFT